jgi:hypothetical protein
MLSGNIPLAACSGVRFVRPTRILPALLPICPFRQATHPLRVLARVYAPASWFARGISGGVKPVTNLQQKKDKSEETAGVKSGSSPVEPESGIQSRSLLSEEKLTTKEQRKADWAIMKEMARYLWPKVSILSN